MSTQKIGLIGLAVMGQNLVLNIERNGYPVSVYNRTAEKTKEFMKQSGAGKKIVPYYDLKEFVQSLERPRRIIFMVKAGKAVDDFIALVKPYLEKGDILIDAGNTLFNDTNRRIEELSGSGVLYIGTGVSGGEEGALWGPSIMPGGNAEAWQHVKPIFQAISAKTDAGEPCCEWLGNGGAGHFVKMVHNGIEYGDMQMICEAYWLMEKLVGLTTEEMHNVFAEWNKGELNSYLIEITRDIMAKKDPDTGKPLIHLVLDTAGQKGTGKWTSQVALDLGSPAQTIADAVFARMLSAVKTERVAASKVLTGPAAAFRGDKKEFVEMIRKALYCSKICSYAQGFQLLRAADEEYKWKLNYGSIALLWRGGCIIRAQFLGKIKEAYDHEPGLSNLLLAPYFRDAVLNGQAAWRTVVGTAVANGIPVPAFMSALSYFDSYRSANLPANLLQAQRDYFGAHTYQRIDKEGIFHSHWK